MTKCPGMIRLHGETSGPPPGAPILIIGNGATGPGVGAREQAASWVIRFNNCAGFEPAAGDRVDELWLVNCGGQMEEWLDENRMGHPAALRLAKTVTFPVHPGIAAYYEPILSPDELVEAAAQDFTWPALRWLRQRDRSCRMLMAGWYRDAAAALGEKTFRHGMSVPSTGFLALFHAARAHPRSPLTMAGFGFAGWDGHPWKRERTFCEGLVAQGRLRLAGADCKTDR